MQDEWRLAAQAKANAIHHLPPPLHMVSNPYIAADGLGKICHETDVNRGEYRRNDHKW